MAITLEQLATAAQCSKATASKALRGDRNVAAATRQRVRKVATQMNYDPRSAKRGRPTKAQEVFRIGLLAIAHDRAVVMRDANFIRFLDGVESEAASAQVEVILEVLGDDLPRCVAEHRVDALVVYGEQSSGLVKYAENLPVILCTERLPRSDVAQVIKDNQEGAALATRHLLSLGHKRIVFATHSSKRQWARERTRGYELAMGDADLESLRVDDAGIVDDVIDSLAQRILELKPTGVVAGNDALAKRLYRRFEQRGISVPQDISLIGFDHTFVSDWDGPELTTIDACVEQVGQEAVHLLRTHGQRLLTTPLRVVVPPKLVKGQTACERCL